MSNEFYKLDGKIPVPVDSILELGEMFMDPKTRIVRQTLLTGAIKISTVFLGINHNFGRSTEPILFETMVFGSVNEHMERYSTWDEAEKGHDEVLKEFMLSGFTVIEDKRRENNLKEEFVEVTRFELMDFE